MSQETIKVPQCIHCGGTHTYSLKVERSYLMKKITTYEYEPPRSVKITRLFVCPVKNMQYEATFYLEESSSNRIAGVDVSGVLDD